MNDVKSDIAVCKEMSITNLLIDENEFKEALLELSESGYFLSAEVYNKLMEG